MRAPGGEKMKTGDMAFGVAAAFLFGIFVADNGWNIFRMAAAGMLYYHSYNHWQTTHSHVPSGKDVAFFGVITEAPKPAGDFTMLVVSLLHPYAGTLDIFTFPGASQFHYGDEIWISGSVAASKDAADPPAIFLPQLRVIAAHQGSWLKEWVINAEQAIEQKIALALPADQAALLAAIMLGTSAPLGAALKAQMETSGTSYIVNMYGYKIIVITFALSAMLKDHVPRRVLVWITLGAIGSFVFLSGGTISAIRAGIMGSLAVVARGTGRVFSARNAVTFAALGMAIANAAVLTDAAFQLSFLSFLGIYYLGPPIKHFFHWTEDAGAFQWRSHTILSLSTNLAILPVVMNTFGSFSLTSFFSNILIMIPWLAVLVSGILLVLFSCLAPPLTFCAAQMTGIVLRYELFIIHFFSACAVPLPPVFGSPLAISLYYGVLILFAHYYVAPSSEKSD